MATFIIVPTSQTPQQKSELDAAIKKAFENKAYQLPKGEWMVSYEGTSRQLSDSLKISDGEMGSAMVLNFSGYWGRANKDAWEWLGINQQ